LPFREDRAISFPSGELYLSSGARLPTLVPTGASIILLADDVVDPFSGVRKASDTIIVPIMNRGNRYFLLIV